MTSAWMSVALRDEAGGAVSVRAHHADLAKLVIVGQDDGAPFTLQSLNLVLQSHGHSQITYPCRYAGMLA